MAIAGTAGKNWVWEEQSWRLDSTVTFVPLTGGGSRSPCFANHLWDETAKAGLLKDFEEELVSWRFVALEKRGKAGDAEGWWEKVRQKLGRLVVQQ